MEEVELHENTILKRTFEYLGVNMCSVFIRFR